jgi:hypothetical protein
MSLLSSKVLLVTSRPRTGTGAVIETMLPPGLISTARRSLPPPAACRTASTGAVLHGVV